ncbi:MAG: type II toxin-antitoxin system PemK/MazF family toxin [Tepidisphaeraceae bacterium]
MMIAPGGIYPADLGEGGRRPVIVVSREELNRGRYVLAVVCTSAHFELRRKLPNCVPFLAGQFGFSRDCVAQCENILSIDKSLLDLTNPLGVLDDTAWRDVIRAIGYVTASECEPM